MKPQFNKTWLIISLVIIANIFVFKMLTNKLEGYVVTKVEYDALDKLK